MGTRKILIIDDDSSVRECYGRLFRREGYDPRLEASAISVERNLEEHRDATLVIMDYRMPGINGLELLRRLREREFGAAVIMVTAFATPQMFQEARRLGVCRVLAKPVDVSQLLRAVEQCLQPQGSAMAGETDQLEV